ncbi:amidase [Pollutimonas sp. M17]|uniref:amidase n=1 Tax=Pollutimonas sp. M17 TaxID=2962065 RepID=UPI0021F3F300|nr:amidase [Pollutimonas sp. M17]UYO93651.1 amidase [Pollutimonas sp. M17]HWK71545.1 amidase [Burkholderiaceae bacterium]
MNSRYLSDHPSFSSVVDSFKRGQSTPREYLETCIAAIERFNPTIQAFTHTNLDKARKLADESTARYRAGSPLSPIDGMPIGVKDIIDTADMPTQMNSPIYEGHYPRSDAAAVRALYEGGGIPVGKTVTTEFAIGVSGPTVNPHNTEHTPGGSSSGSAAGTAAGMFSAALGTQTQGSIIRPASFCGVIGYKPTWSALSSDGIHPLSTTHDHLGTIADSVDDAWKLARWISERAPQQNAPGLSGPMGDTAIPPQALETVAVLRTQGYETLDEASLEAFDATLERLREKGVRVVEPDADGALASLVAQLDAIPDMSQELLCFEMRWPYMGYASAYPDKLSQKIHAMVEQGKAVTRDRYREILAIRNELRRQIAARSGQYDAFVLPSASGPAPRGLEYTGDRTLLVYGSLLGVPAYSLPVMDVDSMPLGLQLMGYADADYRLTCHAAWVMDEIGARARTNA